MSIREKGAEIAFGASALLFTGGAAADMSAEHIGRDHQEVEQLQGQSDVLQARLNEEYPVYEAQFSDGSLTYAGAEERGVDDGWFGLHVEFDLVQLQIDRETEGSQPVDAAGKVMWILGASGMFIANEFMKTMRSNELRGLIGEDSRMRYELDAATNLSKEVVGLRVSENVPEITADSSVLRIFTYNNAQEGLAAYVKSSRDEIGAATVNDFLPNDSGGQTGSPEAIELISPLFGAKIVAGSELKAIDASDLGQKLDVFANHVIQLQMIARRWGGLKAADKTTEGAASSIPSALLILDKILPLDQTSLANPTCDSEPDSPSFGRHWIDFIEARCRVIESEQRVLQGQ